MAQILRIPTRLSGLSRAPKAVTWYNFPVMQSPHVVLTASPFFHGMWTASQCLQLCLMELLMEQQDFLSVSSIS